MTLAFCQKGRTFSSALVSSHLSVDLVFLKTAQRISRPRFAPPCCNAAGKCCCNAAGGKCDTVTSQTVVGGRYTYVSHFSKNGQSRPLSRSVLEGSA
jgi:hypothetical protein